MTEGPVRYAEDYQAGEVFELGTRSLTKEEIVEFSKAWDPHPFHVDEEAAKATMFGGLIASGMHTMLVTMRMMHEGGFLFHETSVGAPGIDEIRWFKPVRPGDKLSGRVEVTGVRISKSRPELGLVANIASLRNQDGDVVYSAKSTALIKSRVGAGGNP